MVVRTIRKVLLAANLFIILSVAAQSQIAGGLTETHRTDFGGRHFIAGTVFSPSGEPVNTRMRIKLVSLEFREIIATTDSSGKFVFSGVSNGTYSLIIDGERDFEDVSENIEISSRGPQTFTVSIRLNAKKNTDLKAKVIRADDAAIPKRAMDLYYKALDLGKTGNHLGAIEQLKLAVSAYPGFVTALTEIGVQYLLLNELENADNAFQSALKIKPDAFEPLVNRGIALFRLKRFSDAEQVLREALKVKDLSAVGHFYLGRTLIAQKRFDEAEKELKYSISIGGDEMKESHRMLASIYLETGKDKLAIVELETYLNLNPGAPDAEKLRTTLRQLKELESPSPTPTPEP